MRQQNDLDSYRYISAGSIIITVATIILGIMVVVLGVIASIAYDGWLCMIIIPSGGISIAIFYVFGKMVVATCHNIYIIKANTDKTLMIQQTKLSKKKPNEAHVLKQIEILNENETDMEEFDYENLPKFGECPNCFAKISPDDIECPNCGYRLKTEKKQEE